MRLQQKTKLYFLLPGVLLIIICGLFQYQLVNARIHSRVDKQLEKEKRLINKQLRDLKNTEELKLYKTLKSEIEIREDFKPLNLRDTFYVKSSFDEALGENVTVKTLEFKTIVGTQTYIVKVKKPLAESEAFVSGLVWANILLFSLIFLVYMVYNQVLSKKIWSPFYQTLQQLKAFNISYPQPLNLQVSDIEEFNRLNMEVDLLIKKVSRDYNNYKSFIENVSHEIQTPIAVARVQMDLLYQSTNIKEQEHLILTKLTANLNKLTRLNQALIFLLKIENNLFVNQSENDLNQFITEALSNFEDIIAFKKIDLRLTLSDNCIIKSNAILAEVMIDNLIKNAVKHNYNNGYIEVITTQNTLTIKNSGVELNCKPEFMFERFRRSSTASDSTGLGLSIVHQICTRNNFTIKYSCEKENHKIEVRF